MQTTVTLFGLGTWGRLRWLPPLRALVRRGEIALTMCDVSETVLHTAQEAVEQGEARYFSWANIGSHRDIQIAILAVPPRNQLEVVRSVLATSPTIVWVLCEKPGGASSAQFAEMEEACAARGVHLRIVDHFLLRPAFRRFLEGPDRDTILSSATSMEGVLAERSHEGPTGEPAHSDMLVHLLMMLHVLLPGGSLSFSEVVFGKASERTESAVTYAMADGVLRHNQRDLPFRLEVGKQLAVDRKALTLHHLAGTTEIDLSTGQAWSYEGLLTAILNDTCDPPSESGAVSPEVARNVWEELDALSRLAGSIRMYQPGTNPELC